MSRQGLHVVGGARLQSHGTREVRKLVTVLFCDLVDSTQMVLGADPEVVRAVTQRYFDLASRVIHDHGGTDEKFIGDAVMAVFGHPQQREDDALRALRAAIDLRDRVAAFSEEVADRLGLSLIVRIGVDTGQVVAGDVSSRQTFVTGDAVNVAARLQQAAGPGEVLAGAVTYALTRHAVLAEPTGPLDLKGKGATPAWRILRVRRHATAVAPVRRAPLVGRERELRTLEREFEGAVADRRCRRVALLGDAGIGKTRLADELVARVAGRAAVLQGRCPSYGTDITYRPVLEMIRQAADLHGVTSPEAASARLATLLGDGEDAAAVVEHLRFLVEPAGAMVSREDIFWAIRMLIEGLGRERALVVRVDDADRAAPTLLDLLEHVAERTCAPVLLLCLARPELIRLRPEWGEDGPRSQALALEPLGADESRRLVDAAGIDEALAARLVGAAEGNPLFLEQMLAHALDEPGGGRELNLPPTIQALIGARLDQLAPAERDLLGRAAVIGGDFDVAALAGLAPGIDEVEIAELLRALGARELVRPGDGPEQYRFWHGLVREAVYESMPKGLRADLHERIARTLEAGGADDQLELVGYHLERAYRLQAGLGFVGEAERALAREAAASLAAAADLAVARDDLPGAVSLLERAVDLAADDPAAEADYRYRLGSALFAAGRLEEAEPALGAAIAGATASGDRALMARARVEQEFVRLQGLSGGRMDGSRQVADEALAVCADAGDELGQCRAHMLRAWTDWIAGRVARAEEAWSSAEAHARRGALRRRLLEIQAWLASAAVFGPTPAPEAIRRCEAIRDEVAASSVVEALILSPLAALYAMQRDFDGAAALLGRAHEVLSEVALLDAAVSHHGAMVDMLRGDPAAAEAQLRAGYARLEGMAERTFLSTTAAMLGQAVHAQGRDDEAAALARQSAELAAPDDVSTHVVWRGVLACTLARRGETAEAEALAREAVEMVARTDWCTLHGDALTDLAEVLDASGRRADAARARAAAVDLYERKGNLVAAERTRARLAEPARE